MTKLTVRILNADDIEAALRSAATSDDRATTATRFFAEAILEELRPYPPAPPRGNPWYERGVGLQYRRRDGTVRLIRASEQLDLRWRLSAIRNGQRLENTASYAGWVHSAEDQAAVHKRTGWLTDDAAIDRVVARDDRILTARVREDIPL